MQRERLLKGLRKLSQELVIRIYATRKHSNCIRINITKKLLRGHIENEISMVMLYKFWTIYKVKYTLYTLPHWLVVIMNSHGIIKVSSTDERQKFALKNNFLFLYSVYILYFPNIVTELPTMVG